MSHHSKDVLHVYRRILKAAAAFPSIKRKDIIQEIKATFREHRALKDPEVIDEKMRVARRSLEELESYVSMNASTDGHWSKTLKGSCE